MNDYDEYPCLDTNIQYRLKTVTGYPIDHYDTKYGVTFTDSGGGGRCKHDFQVASCARAML